jgi:hypothetical protein
MPAYRAGVSRLGTLSGFPSLPMGGQDAAAVQVEGDGAEALTV